MTVHLDYNGIAQVILALAALVAAWKGKKTLDETRREAKTKKESHDAEKHE